MEKRQKARHNGAQWAKCEPLALLGTFVQKPIGLLRFDHYNTGVFLFEHDITAGRRVQFQ